MCLYHVVIKLIDRRRRGENEREHRRDFCIFSKMFSQDDVSFFEKITNMNGRRRLRLRVKNVIENSKPGQY